MRKFSFFLISLILSAGLFAQGQQSDDALELYRRGRTLESEGNITEANRLYNQSLGIVQKEISSNPNNIDSHLVKSWVCFRLKQYDKAVEAGLAGLRLNKNDSRIFEALGEAYFALDKYDTSKYYFEKFVVAQPNADRTPWAYFYLGEIFRLTQKYNHAEIAYGAALHKQPSVALWWYRLGVSRRDSGDKVGAKQAWQRALQINPKYADAKEALDQLG